MTTTPLDAEELARVRDAIAALDTELVALVARRHGLVHGLWARKRNAGLPLRDEAREHAILRAAEELARFHDLRPDAVRRVFEAILDAMHDAPTSDGGSLGA